MEYQITTLERDDDRPLRGRMALIGEGSHGTGGTSGYRCDWTRGVDVRIYAVEPREIPPTSAAVRYRYAVSRVHWTKWLRESERREAWLVATPEALLASLREGDESAEERGNLYPAETEAWAEACKADPELAPLACEEI